jgi:hypothetical protein
METNDLLFILMGAVGLMICVFKSLQIYRSEWRATKNALDCTANAHGGNVYDETIALVSYSTKAGIRKRIMPFLLAMPFYLCSIILTFFVANVLYKLVLIVAIVIGTGLVIFGWLHNR